MIIKILVAFIVVLLGVIVFDNIKISAYAKEIARYEAIATLSKNHIEQLVKRNAIERKELNNKYEDKITKLKSDINRLRVNSRASILPPVPPASKQPNRICFSRDKLDGAIQQYRGGVQGLVEEGTRAIIGMEIAREWVELNE